jgi:hypothetical protein
MENMFEGSQFDEDISDWDVSRVVTMKRMFKHSLFDRDISDWEISKNCDLKDMFDLDNDDLPYWYIEDYNSSL